jgi:RND family efflux transporter MFP subunit
MRSRWIAALLPGILLAVASCSPPKSGGAEGTAVRSTVIDVVSVRPALDPHDVFLTFLEPAVDAPVIARSDGIVRAVHVREGQRVGRGQALARLDSEEQRLEVDYVGALAAQAKAELERAEKGATGQWVSRQTLDAARAKAAATRADLELAKLALERRTLRAPVGGIVWQVRAEAHRPVKTSDVLFRVTEPGHLKAELFLPASMQGRVHAGDPVTFVPVNDAALPAVKGRVKLVSPIVDPATARFRAELEATRASEGVAGTNVRVRLASADSLGDGGAGAGALLPRGALLERSDDRLYVWRVAGGKATRVPIELGAGRPDGYEVLAGLAPGDLVRAAGSAAPAPDAVLTPRLRTR